MRIRKATTADERPIIDLLNRFPSSDQMTSDSEAIGSTFHHIIRNAEL